MDYRRVRVHGASYWQGWRRVLAATESTVVILALELGRMEGEREGSKVPSSAVVCCTRELQPHRKPDLQPCWFSLPPYTD